MNINSSLAELSNYKNWLVYGKDSKSPLTVRTLTGNGWNQKSYWATYEEARKCLERNPKTLEGLTFMVTKNTPFTIIDLDHCRDEEGNLTDKARDIVEKLDTYTEVSPSGTGLHLICKGKIPKDLKTDEIEIYSNSKPIRLSFKSYKYYGIKEPRECQDELEELYFKYSYKDKPEKATNEDIEVNDLAADNLAKIPQGQRNNTLIRQLGIYCDKYRDLSKEQIKALIRVDNLRCEPPLSNQELENAILKNLDRYYKGTNEEKAKSINKEQFRTSFLLNGFMEACLNNKKTTQSGYKNLDIALCGGFANELYVLGGETGTGKSAFTYQMALQIAETGTPVYYFALEMSANEMIARAVSHYSDKYTVGDILYKRYERDLDKFSIIPYEKYADYVDLFQSSCESLSIITNDRKIWDIDSIVKFCDNLEENAIIFIDYLQIIPNKDKKMTDKEKIDTTVNALKKLSTKHPVIALSSMNRAGYGKSVKLDGYKASGEIEYTGSVLLGLNNLTVVEKGKLSIVMLEILKFRNGMNKRKLFFLFHNPYNNFTPISMNDRDYGPFITKALAERKKNAQ